MLHFQAAHAIFLRAQIKSAGASSQRLGSGEIARFAGARVIEEPRLREQDWANFQITGDIEDQKELRNAYGHFFYRFREGESGSDVYDRISSFMETLYRHWSKPDYAASTLLVTHGLTMRLFCMRWFHWSVEYFESLNNPDNAAVRTLVRTDMGKYQLDIPFSQWVDRRVDETVLDAPPVIF